MLRKEGGVAVSFAPPGLSDAAGGSGPRGVKAYDMLPMHPALLARQEDACASRRAMHVSHVCLALQTVPLFACTRLDWCCSFYLMTSQVGESLGNHVCCAPWLYTRHAPHSIVFCRHGIDRGQQRSAAPGADRAGRAPGAGAGRPGCGGLCGRGGFREPRGIALRVLCRVPGGALACAARRAARPWQPWQPWRHRRHGRRAGGRLPPVRPWRASKRELKRSASLWYCSMILLRAPCG